MTKRLLILGLGALIFSAAYSNVLAQATKSVNDGVYTAEQAKRGDTIYKEQCAACHGDNLEGAGPMPPLAGKDFLTNWQGKTVGDLFEKTNTSMPATAPGSLTPEQTADIIAYMLQAGKYPVGTAPLDNKLEALAQIKVEPAK
jgi:mono/diheme cytochrome c family protein